MCMFFWMVGKGRNVIVSRVGDQNVFCGSYRDPCAFHPLGEL